MKWFQHACGKSLAAHAAWGAPRQEGVCMPLPAAAGVHGLRPPPCAAPCAGATHQPAPRAPRRRGAAAAARCCAPMPLLPSRCRTRCCCAGQPTPPAVSAALCQSLGGSRRARPRGEAAGEERIQRPQIVVQLSRASKERETTEVGWQRQWDRTTQRGEGQQADGGEGTRAEPAGARRCLHTAPTSAH